MCQAPPCTNVKPPRTSAKPPYWRISGDGFDSNPRKILKSCSLFWEKKLLRFGFGVFGGCRQSEGRFCLFWFFFYDVIAQTSESQPFFNQTPPLSSKKISDPTSSDGFTRRPHRPWPRAPRKSFLWRLIINLKSAKLRRGITLQFTLKPAKIQTLERLLSVQ